ncbi:unnamed protein product [Protopolystoma xenopodis]|uniref:Uncharacterized protein n=1 Tax=Protopolystoma xenopodis TaxID=117903 RepID=A0A448X153_9PLAT|nr:unnamed protein product [Protopolystoma xenopodis]
MNGPNPTGSPVGWVAFVSLFTATNKRVATRMGLQMIRDFRSSTFGSDSRRDMITSVAMPRGDTASAE